MGRLPIISPLAPLAADDLVKVLTEPKNALVKQYQKLFEMESAELEFLPEALRQVAATAIEKETGARGLRSVMEQVMFELMYQLPDSPDRKKYVVTGEMVRGEKPVPIVPGDSAAA